NRGGEKISPLEVDAVLLAHPAVHEVATFGAPDAKYGEEVHAAVVLKADATVEQLQAHCAERLAGVKVPKGIYLAQAVAAAAAGKGAAAARRAGVPEPADAAGRRAAEEGAHGTAIRPDAEGAGGGRAGLVAPSDGRPAGPDGGDRRGHRHRQRGCRQG